MSSRDSIGFSLSLIYWGGTLVASGIVIAFLDRPFTTVMDRADADLERGAAADGLHWVSMAWDALPWVLLVLGMVMLVAAAAYRSGRGF